MSNPRLSILAIYQLKRMYTFQNRCLSNMKKITTTFLIMYLCLAFYADAQQKRNPAEAKTPSELELIFKENFIIEQANIALKAKELNIPVREIMPNGVVREFIRISPTGMPLYYQTNNNLDAAKTISTNKVWPGGTLGLNLTGLGMTNRMAVWDGGGVRLSHQEFAGRATQTDASPGTIDHATHVAGTMCATGVVANAKGMSYQAPIKCYDWNNDESEMSNAAAVGLLVSNHSYSLITGWDYNNSLNRWEFYGDPNISATYDYKFGFYDYGCQEWDQIAVSYPNYLPFVAAGNDRGEPGTIPSTFWVKNSSGSFVQGNSSNPPAIVGPYNSIGGGTANAKNVITIGAVSKLVNGWSSPSGVVMSSFSGWGPTDDGRIKPDVVANGVSVYSCTAASNTSYSTYNGTSMACPNASGSALLIQQHYNTLKNTFMRGATLKGLIIHTADEAGTSTGPDYTFGWGLMNTAKAVQTITDSLTNTIQQKSVSTNNPYNFTFFSDGIKPIRATICWTDPAGNPVSPALNPVNKMLVNDLDLRVKRNSDNQLFYPYTLSLANPSAAAATGDNSIDNVEQVYIAAPPAGTYTVTVNYKGSLQSGLQNFSLIVSGVTPKPMAGFKVVSKIICTNKSTQFTDMSTGATSRMWYFTGGIPATSTALNPLVSYPVPGVYPVALRIIGASGYDSVYAPDYITAGGIGLPIDETFEPASTTRNLWTIDNPNADTTWRYWTVAGTIPGNTAYGINNFDNATGNRQDRIVSPVLDLRGYQNANLTFQYAYTRYDNSASDSLIVYVSSNCGNTWIRLLAMGEKGTGNFATAPDSTFQSVNAFVPSKAADWCGGGVGPACKSIDLTPYIGLPNVLVRLEQKSNNGSNNMFIDNIKITGTGMSPVANFYAVSKTVCTMDDVQFLDSSQNQPNEWKWYFSGTDTLTYTVRNPNVKFLTPGTKTIILVVKNSKGTDSIAKVDYITVLPSPAQPGLTSSKGTALCDGDSTLVSTDAVSNFSWYKNSIIQGITASSFMVKEEATYFVRVLGANGCYAKSIVLDILTSTTPVKPTLTSNLSGNAFCEGGNFNLISSADNLNQWMVNNVLQPGQTSKIFNYADSGNFKVQVGEKGCYNYSDILRIDKLPKPLTSEISGAGWAVKEDTANFSVTPGIAGSSFNWTFSGATIITGSGTSSIRVKFGSSAFAIINVQETAASGCKGLLKTRDITLVNTGIKKNPETLNLNIYPNPASQWLTLDFELTQMQNVQISVYSILGQQLLKTDWILTAGLNQKQVDISKFPAGIYFLKLSTGEKVFSKSFVKE